MSSIILLTKEPGTYDSRSLLRAIEQAGCSAITLDYTKSNASSILADSSASAIIPRHTPTYCKQVALLTAQAEKQGMFSTASAHAIELANNKLTSYDVLTTAWLDTPKTLALSRSTADLLPELKKEFGTHCVIKPVTGSQGFGVELVALSDPIDLSNYAGTKSTYLAQEYIAESHGQDLRVIVVDDKPVAAMLRSSANEDMRSNLHLGGKAFQVILSDDEANAAVLAAKAFGLKVAGIDILRSSRGPLVLEVNSSPGLMGIEKLTGINVAGEVLSLITRSVN